MIGTIIFLAILGLLISWRFAAWTFLVGIILLPAIVSVSLFIYMMSQ